MQGHRLPTNPVGASAVQQHAGGEGQGGALGPPPKMSGPSDAGESRDGPLWIQVRPQEAGIEAMRTELMRMGESAKGLARVLQERLERVRLAKGLPDTFAVHVNVLPLGALKTRARELGMKPSGMKRDALLDKLRVASGEGGAGDAHAPAPTQRGTIADTWRVIGCVHRRERRRRAASP